MAYAAAVKPVVEIQGFSCEPADTGLMLFCSREHADRYGQEHGVELVGEEQSSAISHHAYCQFCGEKI